MHVQGESHTTSSPLNVTRCACASLADRHLFELKWVERELSKVCSVYQQTRALHNLHAHGRGCGG